MKVLVDTTIWSLALRRNPPERRYSDALRQIILEHRAVLCGPVRQEVLSGIASQAQFAALRTHLQAFDDVAIATHHYELAAEYSNACRAKGVQGSHVDFLICAVAKAEKLAIFTTDADFARYSDVIGLALFTVAADA